MANTKSLKPFQPGDKRINRDGRPKNGGELGALFRRIGNEIATTKDGKPLLGPDGKPMTVVEAIARQKAQDKKYQEEFLNRAYGKVPDKHQFENEDGSAFVLRVEYVNKRTDNNPTDAA
jgi:hypothetical protein